ncbi:putative DNA-binding regulatory protein [Minicystis rosea]|nr:putative DNA-binding regulatory protein [Minicystis rosea]
MADDGPAQAIITAMHAAGVRAHPEITLDRAAFARFVQPLAASAEALSALHAADLYLVCACALGDERAVAVVETRHLARIAEILTRRRRAPAEVDEVAQRTRERLFVGRAGAPPKIAEYAGRGPLDAWLRVLVLRVDADQRRRTRPHESLDAVTTMEWTAQSPEHLLARARWQHAFDEALREAFAALTPEDRALFRFQFGKGLTLDQIAVILGAHRATVARRIAAARETLWKELTARLRARLGLAQRDLDHLLGEWRSKLDVSLSGLLRASDDGG